MKTVFKSAPEASALRPLEEHPEYQAKVDHLARLKAELRRVDNQRTEINSYYRNIPGNVPLSRIDRLTREYLGGEPVDRSEPADISKKSQALYEEYSALYRAIEQLEREISGLRHTLSYRTAEAQQIDVRIHARDILNGMLAMKRGNDAIATLRDRRVDLGYLPVLPHFGVQPVPVLDDPADENSVWQFILREFIDAGHITDGERKKIMNGLRELEP